LTVTLWFGAARRVGNLFSSMAGVDGPLTDCLQRSQTGNSGFQIE
jgi:hypothetical protein